MRDKTVAAWLDQILGPVTGEHPELAHHKQRITCECPQCGEAPDLAELEAGLTPPSGD